jgi:hypothetical protein
MFSMRGIGSPLYDSAPYGSSSISGRPRRAQVSTSSRRRSSESAVGQAFERGRHQAVVVGLDRVEIGAVHRERLQGAKVARGLDQHFAAFVDQYLAQQVERLLRAGHHQDLLGQDLAVGRGQVSRNPFAQRGVAVGRAVLEGLFAGFEQHLVVGGAHALDREGGGRRQAAGEGDDLRTLGNLQDFADRRALQLLRAFRKLPLDGIGIFDFHTDLTKGTAGWCVGHYKAAG